MAKFLLHSEDKARELYQALKIIPDWAIASLVLFETLAAFARSLLRPGSILSASDFLQYYFWEDFVRLQLASGVLPQWNPFMFAGYPAMANPQFMVFYPPAILLRVLPIEFAFTLGILLHVWWAGVGMYMLMRRQGVSGFSSFIAALASMFSDFIMPRIRAGHIDILYSVTWLPWAVLFVLAKASRAAAAAIA